MADRTLSVPDLIKLYRGHGCAAFINANGIVIVERTTPEYRRWSQHAHKGLRDTFERRVVARSRKRLGFGSMSDADFYGPLD
jgi:hypothetical protein